MFRAGVLLFALLVLGAVMLSGCADDLPGSAEMLPGETTATSSIAAGAAAGSGASSTVGDSPTTATSLAVSQIVVSGPATISRPMPDRVLVSAPWGAGAGEFGLDRATGAGPRALGVVTGTDDGTFIAITDEVNHRVQVYRLGLEEDSFTLAKTIDVPDVAGGLRDVVIDRNSNIYVLRGQDEVLALRLDSDEIRRFPIDAGVGARRLRLTGGVLYVEGSDGRSYGVAGADPSQGFIPVGWEDSVVGIPLGMQGPLHAATLDFRDGRARVTWSYIYRQEPTVECDFEISSPDLPIRSAEIIGVDHISNIWVLLHIGGDGWAGTESWLIVVVSEQGEMMGEFRLPVDHFVSMDVALGEVFPFDVYELRGTEEGLTVDLHSGVVPPITTTTIGGR